MSPQWRKGRARSSKWTPSGQVEKLKHQNSHTRRGTENQPQLGKAKSGKTKNIAHFWTFQNQPGFVLLQRRRNSQRLNYSYAKIGPRVFVSETEGPGIKLLRLLKRFGG